MTTETNLSSSVELTLAEQQEQQRLAFCEELKAKYRLQNVFIIRTQRVNTDELDDTDPKKFVYWYVRRPKPIEAIRMNTEGLDETKRANAMSNLVWPCVLHPVDADLKALKEEFPLVYITLGEKLLEIAGIDKNATLKKT